MKKYLILFIITAAVMAGCGADKNPGYSYMPDMTYSRAYETYAPTDSLKNAGVYYNRQPVPGTIARGEYPAFNFTLAKDSAGYAQAAQLKNPLDSLGKINLKEAERLYQINCGICHGDKLDGNGPLFKGGEGPFTAAPKNFMDADMKVMAPGTMFYSVTYGKGQMGSYASQLTPTQRWEIIAFIKSKQGGGTAAAKDSTGAQPAMAKDSSATAKK